jgi:plasmid stabilization system protein ParE
LVSKHPSIRFAKSFFADLDDIFEYITGNFNKKLASDIISDINREITDKLNKNPNLGKIYADDDFYRYIFIYLCQNAKTLCFIILTTVGIQ